LKIAEMVKPDQDNDNIFDFDMFDLGNEEIIPEIKVSKNSF